MADKKVEPEVKQYNPEKPNEDLDLSGFDYDNLNGESFEKYQALIKSLNGFQNRDFVQYMASGIFKVELNDNADKVHRLVGIRINNPRPVNQTRIQINLATNLNDQIHDRNNPASNSRYYLLKK